MQNKEDAYIEVTEQGPYLVHGNIEVFQETMVPDAEGASWDYQKGAVKHCDKDPTALCRCGGSHNAPCCDGSHEKFDWDGKETAAFAPIEDNAAAIEGPNLTLLDNEEYCAYARFCDARGRIWNLVQNGDEESDELAIREAFHCPAGRLMMYNNLSGERLEPELDREIGALEDRPWDAAGRCMSRAEYGYRAKAAKVTRYVIGRLYAAADNPRISRFATGLMQLFVIRLILNRIKSF